MVEIEVVVRLWRWCHHVVLNAYRSDSTDKDGIDECMTGGDGHSPESLVNEGHSVASFHQPSSHSLALSSGQPLIPVAVGKICDQGTSNADLRRALTGQR